LKAPDIQEEMASVEVPVEEVAILTLISQPSEADSAVLRSLEMNLLADSIEIDKTI
jgi:hypothetical protein